MAVNRYKRRGKFPRYLRGAAIGEQGAKQFGAATGLIASLGQQATESRRRDLIELGLKSGRLKISDLGAGDLRLIGVGPEGRKKISVAQELRGDQGGIAGLFSNFARDVASLRHLPAGIITSLGALYQDTQDVLRGQSADLPHTRKEIIEPQAEYLKRQYGGGPGQFFKEFYKHPLFPVLDVATAASLGAGGAAKLGSRVAQISERPRIVPAVGDRGEIYPVHVRDATPLGLLGRRLAGLTRREGRPDLTVAELSPRSLERFKQVGEEAAAPYQSLELPGTYGVPRLYSERPLRKGAQKILDAILESGPAARRYGGRSSLREFAADRYLRAATNRAFARQRLLAGHAAGLSGASHIAEATKSLRSKEQRALMLIMNGITNRGELRTATNKWAHSVAAAEGRPGYAERGASRLDVAPDDPNIQAYVQSLVDAEKDSELVRLIENPTREMIATARIIRTVNRNQARRLGISGVEQQSRAYAVRAMLLDTDTANAVRSFPRTYPIRPTYVPHHPVTGYTFKKRVVDRIAEMIPGVAEREAEMRPTRARRLESAQEQLLGEPYQPYLQSVNLQLFRSGAFRTDMQVILDHVGKVERDLLDGPFSEELIRTHALKDAGGNVIPFRSQDQVRAVTGKGKNELQYMPLGPLYQWHREEIDVLKEFNKKIEQFGEEGINPLGAEAKAELEALAKGSAGEFVKEFLSGMKAEGVALPPSVIDSLRANLKSYKLPDNKVGRMYDNMLNKWRTWTLAYMPRWWVNTAVGSAALAVFHGTWAPGHYAAARRLISTGKIPEEVRLGVAGGELLEAGYRRLENAWRLTGRMYSAVQTVEDHFRSAAYVHALDRESRRIMRETGEAIEGSGKATRFWDENYIDTLVTDPRFAGARDAALDEVNRFFYNFTQLSPVERQWVRRFVPFWGWYKFVTKFVWRLPIEYPGRAQILFRLAELGEDTTNEEFGILPPWIRGAIFLNSNHNDLSYITTFGVNPLAEFANPLDPTQGFLPGTLGTEQLAPPIQAALTAAGYDPYGGEVPLNPNLPIGRDFLGRLVNTETGEEVDIAQMGGKRRFLGSLLRSIPQLRIAEMFYPESGRVPVAPGVNIPTPLHGTGGRPVYRESIPLISPQPMGVRPETVRSTGLIDLFRNYLGVPERHIDLKDYQKQLKKSEEFAKSGRKRRLKRQTKRLAR